MYQIYFMSKEYAFCHDSEFAAFELRIMTHLYIKQLIERQDTFNKGKCVAFS